MARVVMDVDVVMVVVFSLVIVVVVMVGVCGDVAIVVRCQ